MSTLWIIHKICCQIYFKKQLLS